MKTFPNIYKRTSAGKIQQWRIEVEGSAYRTVSGQTDGKKQTSKWTACFGKNPGKANETTDEEQALKQAQSAYDKKLENHYHRSIEDCDKAKFVKAMLAATYGPSTTVDFDDLYSQPKLDGMRCIVNKDGMWSRGGKPINSAPHIFEALHDEFQRDPTMVFDGELYASHLRDDFEKLISLAKKAKPNAEQLAESKANLQYWVYDIIDLNTDFETRFDILTYLMEDVPSVVVTPTDKVENQEQMDQLYQGYLEAGQEGQMLRIGSSLYEGKRTKSLLKRKEFQDEEYEVVAVVEGQGNWTGYGKAVTCKLANGETFNAGIKGDREFCKQLLVNADKHVGSDATIRFQNLSSTGVPRFPVMYHMWDGKRDV